MRCLIPNIENYYAFKKSYDYDFMTEPTTEIVTQLNIKSIGQVKRKNIQFNCREGI
jgi:hypothetical protein